MRFISWSFLALFFLMTLPFQAGAEFPSFRLAQGPTIDTRPSPPKQGCQTITVHCRCENPKRDFKVRNQKIGRINPGDPGECRSKTYIDERAKILPIAYCLRSGQVKDVRQGESRCTATWSCEKPCIIKDTRK